MNVPQQDEEVLKKVSKSQGESIHTFNNTFNNMLLYKEVLIGPPWGVAIRTYWPPPKLFFR